MSAEWIEFWWVASLVAEMALAGVLFACAGFMFSLYLDERKARRNPRPQGGR